MVDFCGEDKHSMIEQNGNRDFESLGMYLCILKNLKMSIGISSVGECGLYERAMLE